HISRAHERGYRRPAGKQRALLPGLSQSGRARRNAHLREGPTRPGPRHEEPRLRHLAAALPDLAEGARHHEVSSVRFCPQEHAKEAAMKTLCAGSLLVGIVVMAGAPSLHGEEQQPKEGRSKFYCLVEEVK